MLPGRTTIKGKEQHSKQKGQSIIENPETQATLGTRRNEDKQNKTQYRKLPNVACISGFSIIDFPFCLLCCSFALIVVLLCLVCPMLLVSPDFLLLTFPSVCSVVPLL
jgi:Flp pilus assembly protein TadB